MHLFEVEVYLVSSLGVTSNHMPLIYECHMIKRYTQIRDIYHIWMAYYQDLELTTNTNKTIVYMDEIELYSKVHHNRTLAQGVGNYKMSM